LSSAGRASTSWLVRSDSVLPWGRAKSRQAMTSPLQTRRSVWPPKIATLRVTRRRLDPPTEYEIRYISPDRNAKWSTGLVSVSRKPSRTRRRRGVVSELVKREGCTVILVRLSGAPPTIPTDAGSRARNGQVAIRRRRAASGAATPLSQARYDGANWTPAATGFDQG